MYTHIHTHIHIYIYTHTYIYTNQASLVDQMVKNLPATWESQVQSLGWEDALEKRMAIYSTIFTWEIPRTEEPSRYSPWVSKSWT